MLSIPSSMAKDFFPVQTVHAARQRTFTRKTPILIDTVHARPPHSTHTRTTHSHTHARRPRRRPARRPRAPQPPPPASTTPPRAPAPAAGHHAAPAAAPPRLPFPSRGRARNEQDELAGPTRVSSLAASRRQQPLAGDPGRRRLLPGAARSPLRLPFPSQLRRLSPPLQVISDFLINPCKKSTHICARLVVD